MTETIGKITLNLDKYPGEDYYCDGSVEDEILDIVDSRYSPPCKFIFWVKVTFFTSPGSTLSRKAFSIMVFVQYLLSLGVTGYNQDTFEVYHRLYDALNITVVSDKNTV